VANKITTTLDLDDSGFRGGMKNLVTSVKDADGFFGKIKAGASSVGDTLRENTAAAALAAGTALVAFSLTAVDAFTKVAKAAQDLSVKTGLSVEDASRWIAIGDDMGVSADALESSLGRVGKQLDSAKWAEYGIATHNAGGDALSTNEILLNTFDALSKIENPTERVRAGTDLFGKSYGALAPLIGRSKDEMIKYLSAVEDGQVITENERVKAEKFRLAQDKLKDAIKEVTLAFGGLVAEFGPVIDQAASVVGAIANINQELEKAPGWVQGLGASLEAFVSPVTGFQTAMGAAKDEVDYSKMSLDELNGLLAKFYPDNVEAATEITNKWRDANGLAKISTDDLKESAKKAADDGMASFSDAANDARDATKKADDAARLYTERLDALYGRLNEGDAWQTYNENLYNFKADTDHSEQSVRDHERAILDLVSALKNVPPETSAKIVAAVDAGQYTLAEDMLTELARDRQSTIYSNIKTIGTGGDLAPTVKGARAAGGPVGPGSWLVGERGPEVVTLGASGTVTPNSALGGSTVINISTSADPAAVVQALRTFVRRNGPIAGLTV
jgi:hypothetical protein